MEKRMISMFLAIIMIMGMLPVMPIQAQAVLSTQETEELYIQMLQLGLVDENGALIEDTVFIEADSGNILTSNLTELRDIVESPDFDVSKTVQVWGTGGTATLEQLFVALAIEEQMEELAKKMNVLAGGADLAETLRSDSGFSSAEAPARIARHQQQLTTQVTVLPSSINIKLSLASPAAEDITVDLGLFGSFLNDGEVVASAYDGNRGDLLCNAMSTVTLLKGTNSVSFSIMAGTISEQLKNNQPGHLDGSNYLILQWNNVQGASLANRKAGGSCVIEIAHSAGNTALPTEYSFKDTMYQTAIPYVYVKLDKEEHAKEFPNPENNGRGHKTTATLSQYLISKEEDTGTVQNTIQRIFPALQALGMGDGSKQEIRFDNVGIVGYKPQEAGYALDFSYIWRNEDILYSDQKTVKISEDSVNYDAVRNLMYDYIRINYAEQFQDELSHLEYEFHWTSGRGGDRCCPQSIRCGIQRCDHPG